MAFAKSDKRAGGLGIDPVAELVYRRMLSHPDEGVSALASGLSVSQTRVRQALDLLSELALVRSSDHVSERLHAVDPRLGMQLLLSRQEAELARGQQRLEESKAVAIELIAQFSETGSTSSKNPESTMIWGLEQIRDNLRMLNEQVKEEFLTFAPGGSQTGENMKAAQPLNRKLLDRGVRMRTVYLDSLTNDPDSVSHAKALVELGAQVRTTPTLPTRMIVCDRSVALIAADDQETAKGAVLIRTPGVVAALCALFEAVWRESRELAPTHNKDTDDGMTPQQVETMRLLSEGHTDEVVARKLGVSTRTARRFASEIMVRLGARSRFQAGVNAALRGHLSSG